MLKRIEPWGYRVDLTRVEPTNPQPCQIQPEDLELEATDYRELPDQPPAGDRPYYEQHFSPYRGLPGAVCGLLLLIGFTLTMGYTAGFTFHHLQQQGGSADARR